MQELRRKITKASQTFYDVEHGLIVTLNQVERFDLGRRRILMQLTCGNQLQGTIRFGRRDDREGDH